MKPSGSIAKLCIDFKATLAEAHVAACDGTRHMELANLLLGAQNTIGRIAVELRDHGLQEPVGRLDTMATMQTRLDEMTRRLTQPSRSYATGSNHALPIEPLAAPVLTTSSMETP
jgi:hypothetical protein